MSVYVILHHIILKPYIIFTFTFQQSFLTQKKSQPKLTPKLVKPTTLIDVVKNTIS